MAKLVVPLILRHTVPVMADVVRDQVISILYNRTAPPPRASRTSFDINLASLLGSPYALNGESGRRRGPTLKLEYLDLRTLFNRNRRERHRYLRGCHTAMERFWIPCE